MVFDMFVMSVIMIQVNLNDDDEELNVVIIGDYYGGSNSKMMDLAMLMIKDLIDVLKNSMEIYGHHGDDDDVNDD